MSIFLPLCLCEWIYLGINIDIVNVDGHIDTIICHNYDLRGNFTAYSKAYLLLAMQFMIYIF